MQSHVKQVVDPFLEAAHGALGIGYSAVLYGSAARMEHVPKQSDINLLLIVPSLTPDVLARLGGPFELLVGKTRTPPLLFTTAEWNRAADAFPIEITDMQVSHVALRGPDPVSALSVSKADLRRALERELRGKLLRLRQGYALFHSSPDEVARVGIQSIATIAILLRVGVALSGSAPPVETVAALRAAGERMGFDDTVVARWYEARRGEKGPGSDQFLAYLAAVEAALQYVDQFHVGGN
ncbi:MAG: hypothetical protein ABI647_21215 [Gemmatimonadota bacterium]